MLPYTLTTVTALLAFAAAQQLEDKDGLFECRGGSGFPVLTAGSNDTLIIGPNANISCCQVQFYLQNNVTQSVSLRGGNIACLAQPMLWITVPDINYTGDVKMTLICDTEYDVPCYKLSMISNPNKTPRPTPIRSKGIFSVNQLRLNTTSSSNSSSFTYRGTGEQASLELYGPKSLSDQSQRAL